MPLDENKISLDCDKTELTSSLPNWWSLALYSGMSGAACATFTFVLSWVLAAWVLNVAINGPYESIIFATVGAMATAGIYLGIRHYSSRALFWINVLLVGASFLSVVAFLIFLSDQQPMGRGIGGLLLLIGGQVCLTLSGICLAVSSVASAVVIWCRPPSTAG